MNFYQNPSSFNSAHAAAHCILDKGSRSEALLPRDALIILGAHDLDQKFEAGRETVPPIRIFIHPDWNPQILSFDGDISLLELEQSVQFTVYIQPICWWQSPSDPPVTSGTVVGYGKSENDAKIHENKPKVIQLPIHSQESCFLSEPSLVKLSSTRTFCAGSGDGKGVCSGDSGGGLVVKVNGVFYLRGVVSSSLIKDYACDVGNYAVFTNVLKYKEWILLKLGIKPTQPSVRPQVTQRPPVIQNSGNSNECGIMSSSSGLIQGGRFASRTQFPWMASLLITFNNFYLNSSGVLLSRRHILTPGTAVSYYNENSRYFNAISLHRVKITLAALSANDRNSISVNPSAITVHPTMKEVDDTPINNVAVITLESLVQFSEFIRPICLWTFNDELRFVSGSAFYTAGYGADESGKVSNIRKYARISLVELQRCVNSYEKYQNIFHETNAFCAQGSSSESACDFDDFLFVKFNDRWYLRGLSLLNFHFDNFNTCNYNEPVLYQDMAQLVSWIQRIANF